jgi:hypothetical protein
VSAPMPGQTDNEEVPEYLIAVFEAAWPVVGCHAHFLDQEEADKLRCDLAMEIARLASSGVRDPRELVRRSIRRFVH